MLRVGFDASALDPSFKEHAARGIGRYVRELSTFFDRYHGDDLTVQRFDHAQCRSGGAIDTIIDYLPAGRATVRQQLVYPLTISGSRFERFDVLHFPAHMDAPSWGSRRCIVTVLDLIPLICNDLYRASRPGWRFHLARFLELKAIRNAELILAISENTARDVQRILGIPAEKIVVTPLGVDSRFFKAHLTEPDRDVRTRYGIPLGRPIVLYVGGIDPRKNYGAMVRVMKRVIESARANHRPIPVFALAGRVQKDHEYPRLLELIRENNLADDFVLTGYVPDPDLLQLYAMSSLFFFPSFYEGFGLPPLEAMAAGLPVVSSNASAMPEVLGDAAILVDPRDEARCAAEIDAVLNVPSHAAELRARGPRQAQRFTWERTGEATLNAYRRFCYPRAGRGWTLPSVTPLAAAL